VKPRGSPWRDRSLDQPRQPVFSADPPVAPRRDAVLFNSKSGRATLDGATRAVERRPTKPTERWLLC
jgi:hypothetical protein